MANTAGSLDITRRIPQRLDALGASLNFFGRCVGLSSSEISNLFSAKKRLSGEKAKVLLSMVDDLEMLQRVFDPAPIKFADHELILGLIHQLKSGQLMIGKMRGGTLEVHAQNLNGWNF